MPIVSGLPHRARRVLTLFVLPGVVAWGAVGAQDRASRDSAAVAPGVRASSRLSGASHVVIDTSDIRRSGALTFSELLQARGASVNVMMSGGRIVDGGHVMVRGPSTFATEGAPLLIVDGMRMNEQQDDGGSTASRLDDVAVGDIATIEILRGPGAAALYGSGASAGVIVVTTKHGRPGAWRGTVRATSEARRDAGNYPDRYRRRPTVASRGTSCSLEQAASGFCVPGPMERWNPLSDAGVFQMGFGASTFADIAGGSRSSDVRASLGARHATGTTPGDRLTQLGTRVNARHRIGDFVELSGRASYHRNQSLGSIAGELIDDIPNRAIGLAPADSFARWAEFKLGSPSIDGILDHLTAGAGLSLHPTRWLTIRGETSRDHVDEGAERIIRNRPFQFNNNLDSRYVQEALGDTRFSDRAIQASSWNTHRVARATGELRVPLPAGLRSGMALIGGTERERRSRYQGRQEVGLKVTESRTYVNSAVFGLARLDIGGHLGINGGVRREKDSGADRTWGSYPTVDASLRGHLMGGEVRVRAAYGESTQRYAMSALAIVEDYVPGIYFGTLPPPRPLPERMIEREGGVDAVWGEHAAISVTTYDRAIDKVAFPSAAPFGATVMRMLELESSGVEVDARALVVRGERISWELRGIVATNVNRVTTDSLLERYNNTGLVGGHPFGVALQRPYTFNDANGDGVLSFREISISGPATDRKGGSTPTLTLALHSEIRIGRSIAIAGVLDRRGGAWSESRYATTLCANPERACRALQDPASSLEEQARAQRDIVSRLDAAYDATFTRLRELTVRWTPPRANRWLAGARPVRVLLSGRDLWTWTSWPGADPEVSSARRGYLTRNDRTTVAIPRRFTIGVEMDY